MHRLAATPGGWSPNLEGVIFVEQTPAPIVILTAADTDIQTLALAVSYLPSDFPPLRVVNLLQLQQQLSIDSYRETVLSHAQVIIVRLLGGRSYWDYGLEVLQALAEETGVSLWILPGDERPDLDLMTHSTVSLTAVNRLWRYLTEAGLENWLNALKFVADLSLNTNYNPSLPQIVPRVGLYSWREKPAILHPDYPQIGLLFYRSHYLSGNTLPIDSICQTLIAYHLNPVPIFVSSLRDPEVQEELLNYFQSQQQTSIQLILNTTSFSIAQLQENSYKSKENLREDGLWQRLNLPVFQVILSSSTEEQWNNNFQGLSPRDVAMNIALPEVDGRIITRAVSFKSVTTYNDSLETDVVIYQPQLDRIKFVVELAANWIKLRNTPPSQRKIALILANYPNKDGRIANGVGLDTPASCIEILQALKKAGYCLDNIPEDGDKLIQKLTTGVTNDPEAKALRYVYQVLKREEYHSYFTSLPESIQKAVTQRWSKLDENNIEDIPIPGLQLDNIFIGIQPSRGYDLDPSLNYHAPDLEPTPAYLAYYYWLKHKFKAHAIIHLGKHGNLEWLPGKSLALSNTCYPEITLATIPHFYPFIVNDPGEGSQAKRRSHAVILDHLTPPMTRAELYGDLAQLETLIDEYYEAQSLDPSRLPLICDRIQEIFTKTNLNQDLGIEAIEPEKLASLLTLADGYLCELKEAQIRDGLHIFGQCPQGKQLQSLLLSIARSPSYNRPGLTQAIAADLNLDLDPLSTAVTEPFHLESNFQGELGADHLQKLKQCRTVGDVVTWLEAYALELIQNRSTPLPQSQKQLHWLENQLIPALKSTSDEIKYLLAGLDGKYVPSGAAGAPTRGRPEVLPTGRNFYSVDIRAIPTETAWQVGNKAAEALIERYCQENGEYPQTLAISVWGTSTMRTGGDDVAQILALLGVKPIWDGPSRRVVGYEILTPSALERPRVDVTVRVSGFFRDGFPNILQLLYNAIKEVSSLKEEKEINPLAAQVETETSFWENQGLTKTQAIERATARIFGSKPGAYGAGLQGLIEAQNWQTDEDLATAYINWGCYAYDDKGIGHARPEVLETRLKNLQVILHNQDNREHDLLDSDDYYQFQGGMTAAVRALTGKNPQTYFGDNSLVNNPQVRLLKEEIARVYRSRVINPKWIEGVMRHGYKGAFEMAATLDYLFAYDATARCVEDFMYQGVADAYLFDQKVQNFIERKNPWALRDMAERLLEANQRGLWQGVDETTLDKLRAIVHQGEGIIESMS